MDASRQVGPLKPTNLTVNGTDCGSCYGAGAPGECCNSCEEVRACYSSAHASLLPVNPAMLPALRSSSSFQCI